MDENSKIGGDGGAPKATSTTTTVADDRNPNSSGEVTATSNGGDSVDTGSEVVRTQSSSRTPFTNLSQEDADLALARTLQEQERAYMMLSMGGAIGYGRWDTGLYVHDGEDDGFGDSHDHEYDDVDDEGDEDDEEEDEDNVENYEDEDEDGDGDEDEDEDEDAFDIHAHTDSGDDDSNRVDLDPSAFPDDEAYARALQDAEEREMAVRLMAMAGITEREVVDMEDHGSNSQDTWEEVDPDELSYEELIALGEVVGTESRGLSADTIASLPSTNYKSQKSEEAETDSCVICRLDYEDDDTLTTLPCKHAYHSDCITNWLNINKACPVCNAEVSTSGNS
ncbi:E3 ubiquitin ligase BIG BROTHER-related [Silene latifolia]|uniref:E3 ubiquitin ligase BIG BROTHER-related n=1 Tax=Silene latifolia TaxID=37657 RepID=UPI003D7840B1